MTNLAKFPLLKLPSELHIHVAEAIGDPAKLLGFARTCRALHRASKSRLEKLKQIYWDSTDILTMLKHYNAELSVCCICIDENRQYSYCGRSSTIKRVARFEYTTTRDHGVVTLKFSKDFKSIESGFGCTHAGLLVKWNCSKYCKVTHTDNLPYMMKKYAHFVRNEAGF